MTDAKYLKLLKEKGFESVEDYEKNNELKKKKVYSELSQTYNKLRDELMLTHKGEFIVINEKGKLEMTTTNIKEWEDYKENIPLQQAFFDTKVGEEEGYSQSTVLPAITLSTTTPVPSIQANNTVLIARGHISISVLIGNVPPYDNYWPSFEKRMVVDSGATMTMLDSDVSNRLHPDLWKGQGQITLLGIGGHIVANKAKIRITLYPNDQKDTPFVKDCTVALLNSNLFGLDLLTNFTVLFDFHTNTHQLRW